MDFIIFVGTVDGLKANLTEKLRVDRPENWTYGSSYFDENSNWNTGYVSLSVVNSDYNAYILVIVVQKYGYTYEIETLLYHDD